MFDCYIFLILHLHDTTCCQTGLTTGCIMYRNIQPVVKPVRQPAVSCIQPAIVYIASCQTGLTTGWTNSGCSVERTVAVSSSGLTTVLNQQPVRSTRLSNQFNNRLYRVNNYPTYCQTSLTTGWMFVYTIQPVVKPVVQPCWQQVVSCKWGFTVWTQHWKQCFQ